MRLSRSLVTAGLVVGAPFGTLVAQAPATKLPPVRALKPVERTASESFVAVSAARALPGGRVLVNDVSGRRLVLFALATRVTPTEAAMTPSLSS